MTVPLLEQNYKILYVVFIALFLITFIVGSGGRGSTRWIPIFSLRFQTSEFFKPVLLIALASILSSSNRFTPRKTLIAATICIVPCILVFLQPNLSSVLLYAVTFLSMFYFSGLSTQLMVDRVQPAVAIGNRGPRREGLHALAQALGSREHVCPKRTLRPTQQRLGAKDGLDDSHHGDQPDAMTTGTASTLTRVPLPDGRLNAYSVDESFRIAS